MFLVQGPRRVPAIMAGPENPPVQDPPVRSPRKDAGHARQTPGQGGPGFTGMLSLKFSLPPFRFTE